MARARLLRQSVEDYGKKVQTVNRDYAERYATYQAGVEAHNAFVNAVNAGSTMGLGGLGGEYSGQYAAVKAGKAVYARKSGEVRDAGGFYKSWEDLKAAEASYTPPFSITPRGPGLLGPGARNWIYDAKTNTADLYQNMSQGTYQVEGVNEQGEPTMTTVTDPANWQRVPTNTLRPVNYYGPGAPEQGEEPKAPNLTVNDVQEMTAPGLNQAEQSRTRAWGYVPKSELAGDDQHSKGSVFSDLREGEQDKEKGVLARVLGGQL
jgi:hypothetical protein